MLQSLVDEASLNLAAGHAYEGFLDPFIDDTPHSSIILPRGDRRQCRVTVVWSWAYG